MPEVNINSIIPLTPEIEERIHTNPLLNIDTFIIPSPYIKDPSAQKDSERSFAWIEEGEILGYMLVYASVDRSEYLIYKLVTSPYGRGRGIGTAFLSHLAEIIPNDTSIYLYVWEKQHETLEFFRNKGFDACDSIVYRNMIYHLLSVKREVLLENMDSEIKKAPVAEEIGRTRHDARKTLSSLTAMVNALAPENAGRIIEDINRETTSLVNMLNMYRDSMSMAHEVNLQELIVERLVPYIESCGEEIILKIVFAVSKPVVLGHWLNISRTLVNLANNAIDSMAENSGPKELTVSLLKGKGDEILLKMIDNGCGIPENLLVKDDRGIPAFVGKSTKAHGKGEGFGTVEVWSIFGTDRLNVASQTGKGTEWTILFQRSAVGLSKRFTSLQRRFHELQGLAEDLKITQDSPRSDVVTAIWRIRNKELFLYELLERFSRYHNMRDLFRTIMSYWQDQLTGEELESRISEWKSEHSAINTWLTTIARRIKLRRRELESIVDLSQYKGALFKSYGQTMDKVIIFTLNPFTRNFFSTDRKLAEHLDFLSYLGGDKEALLRGEFVGDVNIDGNPIYLGVWSVNSDSDLEYKLKLLQDGAQTIINFGIRPHKKLAFYQSTYQRHSRDIDSDASTTFGDFVGLSMKELLSNFSRETDDELGGFLTALE